MAAIDTHSAITQVSPYLSQYSVVLTVQHASHTQVAMTCHHISQHIAAALTPHLKAATDADNPYSPLSLPVTYEMLNASLLLSTAALASLLDHY